MKPTEIIRDLGRTIAFYPGLRKLTGSTTATIFLCQLFYWTGKQGDPKGWIYKTSEEIEEETGLTYNEQKTARAKLLENGLIQEHNARLEHKMYFRVNSEKINKLWEVIFPPIPDSQIPEHDNVTFGNDTFPHPLNSNTEITSETTPDIKDNTPTKRTGVSLPKEPDPRSKHPAILMVKGITGKYPNKTLWDDIIKQLGDHPDGAKAAACYKAWVTKGYNTNALTWLTDWYKTGIPKYNGTNAPARRQAVDADGNVVEVT